MKKIILIVHKASLFFTIAFHSVRLQVLSVLVFWDPGESVPPLSHKIGGKTLLTVWKSRMLAYDL